MIRILLALLLLTSIAEAQTIKPANCTIASGVITCGESSATIGTTTSPGSPVSSLQYNNAGVFGGISGWTTNGSTALTGGANTTIAISGASIGSDSLAWNGTATGSGRLTVGGLTLGGNTILTAGGVTSNNASAFQLTNSTASSTVPTLVPNRASATTGIGAQASGNMSLIASGTEQMRIAASGVITFPTITTDATKTDATACIDTTSKQIYTGTGALGICLGTSGRQFKTDFTPMIVGINELMKIDLLNYNYRYGYGDNGLIRQYGTTAQSVEAAIPDIARHNDKGETINYDSGALLFIGLKAIQQLKIEIDNLKNKQ